MEGITAGTVAAVGLALGAVALAAAVVATAGVRRETLRRWRGW
jgi:hypothetical protein